MHPVGKTIRWIEKWMTPFMMGTTSSITMQSLGKIVQRAGCRCENMVFVCFYFCYWKDCSKCKLPVLNLLTGQKSGFSPRRATHSTDSLLTWHDRRAPGSAWLCKISPRCRDGNPAPKYQKFPLLVKDRPIANLFTDF